MAAVVQPRHRLLPGVAALVERDVGRLEPGLGRQHALVDLATPARHARGDAAQLELLVVERRREAAVDRLARTGEVGREADGLVRSKDEHRLVLLGLDLALRAQTHAQQVRGYLLA